MRSAALARIQASALGCLLLAVGCGSVERAPTRLEVYSWWETESEKNAFSDAAAIHTRQHSSVVVVNVVTDDTQTRKLLTKRMLAGAPPATFLANIGADLLRWTVVDSASVGPVPTEQSRCKIEPLDELYRDLNLASHIPQTLLDELNVGGRQGYYAVPLNIHRLNVIYYNKELHQRYVERHGESFLKIETLCPADWKVAEPLDVRIAIGTANRFALVLLTFENILPALTSGSFYDQLFRGQNPASVSGGADFSTDVRRAVECFKYLSRSFVRDGTLSWYQAASMVSEDRAAFTVMGDWVDGQLKEKLDDEVVVSDLFPGTEGLFVFTSDTFPLPFSTAHRDETEGLLRTFASPRAQIAFSEQKGSIPALDVDPAELTPAARKKLVDFSLATRVVATSGRFPPYYPVDSLGELLERVLPDNAGEVEIENVVTLFQNAYPLLTRWQQRLNDGPAPPCQ